MALKVGESKGPTQKLSCWPTTFPEFLLNSLKRIISGDIKILSVRIYVKTINMRALMNSVTLVLPSALREGRKQGATH